MDALADNEVTNPSDGREPGKFDFVNFDACMMNSIELNVVLSDYTDYYMASPEVVPGYGQYYTGWLNTLGADPDFDTYELGKQIVDDFIDFYENGEGKGTDATMAVVDSQKLMDSGILEAVTELTGLLEEEAGSRLFYDELKSVSDSIEYGMGMFGYYDLGNLASMITVVGSEVSEEDLDKGTFRDTNVYNLNKITQQICGVLEDEDIIYAAGTHGIVSQDKILRTASDDVYVSDLRTSGMHIYFAASPKNVELALKYYDEIGAVLEKLPDREDARYRFLDSYRNAMLDYALLTETGYTVTNLVNTAKVDKKEIGLDKVREWMTQPNDPEYIEFTTWYRLMKPMIDRRNVSRPGTEEWLDSIIRQQAQEAVSLQNITASKVISKNGRDYKVYISDARKRVVGSVERMLTFELPVLKEYIENELTPEEADHFSEAQTLALGGLKGILYLDDKYSGGDTPEERVMNVIRWYNDTDSTWDLSAEESKWYAVNDSDGKMHAAAIFSEDVHSFSILTLNTAWDEEKRKQSPVILTFAKKEAGSRLSEISFYDGASQRPFKPQELTEPLTLVPVLMGTYLRNVTFYLPVSESPVVGSAENADSISLDYVDIRKIPDIRDSDGDGEVINSTFAIRDIYGARFNITDQVVGTEDTLVHIEMAEVQPAVYTGEKLAPVLVYNGETLKEGTDYMWEPLYVPEGEEPPEYIEPGEYDIFLKGTGRFTGMAVAKFRITEDEKKLPGKTTRGDMFNLAGNVKVTWKAVPGAKYYKVYREGVTDPSESVAEPVIVTSRLVGWDQAPGLSDGHKYRYRIVASLTGAGDPSGDSTQSYSKIMYRLKNVAILSAKNTEAGKVTVRFRKTTSGDSYVLQWSEKEDMSGAKTKVIKGAGNTSCVIGGLKKGKTYYISIRVRKVVDGISYYTTFGVAKKVS